MVKTSIIRIYCRILFTIHKEEIESSGDIQWPSLMNWFQDVCPTKEGKTSERILFL